MKVFFLYYGQMMVLEQMFDEEEPKKQKQIDFDELSIEEIEELIKGHQDDIKALKILLEKKKVKLNLAQTFFKKS